MGVSVIEKGEREGRVRVPVSDVGVRGPELETLQEDEGRRCLGFVVSRSDIVRRRLFDSYRGVKESLYKVYKVELKVTRFE